MGKALTVDSAGNSYLCGYFSGTSSFDTFTLTSSGVLDLFVAKLKPLPLVGNFTANITSGLDSLQVQFTDLSMGGDGIINSWLWSFGDGRTSTLQHPLYTYRTPSLYSVSLMVTNIYDSTSTIIRENYITVNQSLPELEYRGSTDLLFDTTYADEVSEYQQVVIRNCGTANLILSDTYLISEQHFEFYRANPDQPILPNMEETIFVRFSPTTTGALQNTLYIVNNSPNQPLLRINLQGTGQYVPPQSPENVNVTLNGYDVVLNWDAVTHNIHNQPLDPDYYLIYFSGSPETDGVFSLLEMSSTNQFTHTNVANETDHMFYRAKAIKLYPPVRAESTDMQELKSRLQQVLKVGMTESEVSKALDHLWDEWQ